MARKHQSSLSILTRWKGRGRGCGDQGEHRAHKLASISQHMVPRPSLPPPPTLHLHFVVFENGSGRSQGQREGAKRGEGGEGGEGNKEGEEEKQPRADNHIHTRMQGV